MAVGRMHLIVEPYFVTEIQERERAISCERAWNLPLRGIKE